jgi:hypothetical protein
MAPRRSWTISLTISSTSDISYLFSPSHEIELIDYSKRVKSITFNRKKLYQPNKDFVLLFRNEEIMKP